MRKQFLRSIATIAVIALLCPLIAPLLSAQSTNQAPTTKTHKLNEINIKFNDDAQIQIENGSFVSQNTDATALNSLLKTVTSSKNRTINDSAKNIKAQRQTLKTKSGRDLADLSSYYTITIRPGTDGTQLIGQLQLLPYVDDAYFSFLPAPAPTSPDFSGLQNYRIDAPTGMGVNTAGSQPGVRGDAVQLLDIEYSWNTNHEDVTDSAQVNSLVSNGTPTDPFNNDNHGTAVTGITNGDHNGFGINGIAPNATLKRVNVSNIERGWDMANAIYVAQTVLGAGDVMLIEQQAWGPNNTFAPVEWEAATYDAITYATAKGIIVIEAAGNGGQNLDDPIYGVGFPYGKPNSGAIIVGAGAACGYQANRSRISYSNYGSRVDVQGWGECVTTSGYGYLSGLTKNEYYISSFSGTSSASALVAAVAAAISSAKETQFGIRMTSAEMRNLLVTTGTAQDVSIAGKIGPLPNLSAALADKIAPSAPTDLTVTSLTATSVSLKWNAAVDNIGVKNYQIFRNDVLITTTSNLTFVNSSLKRNTSYTYKVRAVDAAGNLSTFSNSITVRTKNK